MKKINETYLHEDTGIQFDVKWEFSGAAYRKRVLITPSKNDFIEQKGFVFNRSSPGTIIKIGKALLEIGEFVEKL